MAATVPNRIKENKSTAKGELMEQTNKGVRETNKQHLLDSAIHAVLCVHVLCCAFVERAIHAVTQQMQSSWS